MAANYIIADPQIGAGNVSLTGTVQLAPFGYEARAFDNATSNTLGNRGAGVFVYARGSNVASIGQFVHLSQSIAGGGVSAVLLASANSTCFWPIGVAAGLLSATNVFGWVQVVGLCDYATASNTSIAANAYIALGSTAGQVGTVTALGSRIGGIAIPNSYTSSQTSVTCFLNRPWIFGITASN